MCSFSFIPLLQTRCFVLSEHAVVFERCEGCKLQLRTQQCTSPCQKKKKKRGKKIKTPPSVDFKNPGHHVAFLECPYLPNERGKMGIACDFLTLNVTFLGERQGRDPYLRQVKNKF